MGVEVEPIATVGGAATMAQVQSIRSDLLGELTALERRVELLIGDRRIVFGFRSNGAASMYFGQDFVVGCNPRHEIRRVFLHGELYRAEIGREVVKLVPLRSESTTVLETSRLTAAEQAELKSIVRWHIEMLCRALAGDRFRVLGCVPAEEVDSVLRAVRAELHSVLDLGPAFSDGMAN